MGIWDHISSARDSLKRNTPDITPIKRFCRSSYDYSWFVAGKVGSAAGSIGNAVRVRFVEKVNQTVRDEEMLSAIVGSLGRCAVYASSEHLDGIRGGAFFKSLVSQIVLAIKENLNKQEEAKELREKVDYLEKELLAYRNLLEKLVFTNLFVLGNGMVKFNGLNYADWFEQIQFLLGVMDLDLAIVSDEKPATITEISTEADKSFYEAWKRSNKLSLNLMRMTIDENVKSSMVKTDNAREFMMKIKEYSQSMIVGKSVVENLMSEHTTKKLDWSQPIHDHVIGMENLAANLKSMGVDVSESFQEPSGINSLAFKFGQFQVNYNTLEEKWDLQEIKTMLIQEKREFKKMEEHSVYLTIQNGANSSKTKLGKKKNKKKDKDRAQTKTNEGQIRKDQKCYFCNKIGHFKKDCQKRKEWFEKKGILYDPNYKRN